jgi:hypothetical protein
MSKAYSYPGSGSVRTRLRLSWPGILAWVENWGKQARRGIPLGALVGISMAGLLSAFALFQAALHHSLWFPSVQLNLWQIVAGYVIAFTFAGAVVGAFAPILRLAVGAYLAGILGGMIVYSAVGGLAYGFHTGWLREGLVLGLVGGPVGFYLRYRAAPRGRSSKARDVVLLVVLGVLTIVVELLLAR